MEQDLFVWLNCKRWIFSLSPNGICFAKWRFSRHKCSLKHYRLLELQGFKLALHPPFCKASVSGSGFSAFRSPKFNNKKMIVKDLTVKVSYRVGYGGVEMPQEVYDQLVEAQENGDEIEMGGISKYPDAYEWLSNNIKERDCMDWSAEIDDCIA
jgi:hypothetical protein